MWISTHPTAPDPINQQKPPILHGLLPKRFQDFDLDFFSDVRGIRRLWPILCNNAPPLAPHQSSKSRDRKSPSKEKKDILSFEQIMEQRERERQRQRERELREVERRRHTG